MKLSVIIPTYFRLEDINRTLDSLSKQNTGIDEIIIIIGPGDIATFQLVKDWDKRFANLIILQADKPSLIQSLNLGLRKTTGDIICLLDDDVWLPSDWSEKILREYIINNELGAYGGRDRIQCDDRQDLSDPHPAKSVGIFRWDGALIGNHHRGVQDSRVNVDVLKGVNLSFRRAAFTPMQIEKALEGKGAETCSEVDICQNIIRAGFKVIYDNNNYVLHYASKRVDSDDRSDMFSPAWPGRIFNQSFVTAKFRPPSEIFFFLISSVFLGNRKQPGFFLSILYLRKHGIDILKLPWRNTLFIFRGIIDGFRVRKTLNR